MKDFSNNRFTNEGWILAAMNDKSGRRGIWYKPFKDGCVEVCGGREGDDNYVKLEVGQTLTEEDIKALDDILCRNAFRIDLRVEDGELDCHFLEDGRVGKIFDKGYLSNERE
jgi:hypothetical protein